MYSIAFNGHLQLITFVVPARGVSPDLISLSATELQLYVCLGTHVFLLKAVFVLLRIVQILTFRS